MKRTVITAVLLAMITATPSLAKPRKTPPASIIECTREGCFSRAERTTPAKSRENHPLATAGGRRDVKFIPNPPGTWRIALSCAHRLAAYWGLGKGLDSVRTWKEVFPRASGPAPGVAALKLRRGTDHVIGIIGGGPGAWRVVDFNSGGHRNREYTTDDLSGYIFVDTRSRIASHESNSVR